MARWTGAWLSDLGNASLRRDAPEPPRWRGEHFGLPESGPGAVASGGRRMGGLVVDLAIASLVTALFMRSTLADTAMMQEHNLWSVGVWALITVVPVALFGFTPGMGVAGVRVARIDAAAMVGLWRALLRCVLTFLIVPAVVRNGDGRGWHDRASSTIVLRMR